MPERTLAQVLLVSQVGLLVAKAQAGLEPSELPWSRFQASSEAENVDSRFFYNDTVYCGDVHLWLRTHARLAVTEAMVEW